MRAYYLSAYNGIYNIHPRAKYLMKYNLLHQVVKSTTIFENYLFKTAVILKISSTIFGTKIWQYIKRYLVSKTIWNLSSYINVSEAYASYLLWSTAQRVSKHPPEAAEERTYTPRFATGSLYIIIILTIIIIIICLKIIHYNVLCLYRYVYLCGV